MGGGRRCVHVAALEGEGSYTIRMLLHAPINPTIYIAASSSLTLALPARARTAHNTSPFQITPRKTICTAGASKPLRCDKLTCVVGLGAWPEVVSGGQLFCPA